MPFVYHANALAVGGRMELPSSDVIPSQGSVALSPSGGEGYETIRNFDYKGIISFDEASVYVAGSHYAAEKAHNTIATISLRNLNVLNMLHADLLVARLSTTHIEGEDEGRITFTGTRMEGLVVGGQQVTATLDTQLFTRYPTQKTFIEGFARDHSDSFAAQAERHCWDVRHAGVPEQHGVVVCSALGSFSPGFEKYDARATSPAPITQQGYLLHVKDFGTIRFAEVMMRHGQRRLSLLRFDLGCPFVGSMAIGSLEGNGTDILP